MKQRILFWLLTAILLNGCIDQTTKPTNLDRNQQQVCGATEGAFRSRWWNFVERAQSFAVCEQLPAAVADLRSAIAQRPDDQRRARTYGMHFVDYFPHRELGIILYRQGQLAEAMRELETSLATEKSAKAELYLDRVRTDWIQRNSLDKSPPQIKIDAPTADALVQGFALHVQGTVQDDTFIKSIQINTNPVRIDLAAPHISFNVAVKIIRNQNHIAIVATDLLGRTTQQNIQIYADREGPTVGIQDANSGGKMLGYVEDVSGLAEVRINGERQQLPAHGELVLNTVLPSNKPSVLIEAIDRAGNFTTAKLDFTERLNRRWQESNVLIAALDVVSLGNIANAATEGVTLNYRPEGGDIFLDHIYLEGQARLNTGVSSVRINKVELVHRPGKQVFFSHRIALAPGPNHLTLEAVDQTGRAIVRELILTRKLKQLEQRQARYRLALVIQSTADPMITQPLWQELEKTARFQPIGTGVMAYGSIAEPLTTQDAARMARFNQADGVLVTEIRHNNNVLEYSAQWVDAENAKTMFIVDAYADVDADPQPLALTLMRKAQDALPVLDGEVTVFKDTTLTLEISGVAKFPANIPLTVYRPAPPRTDVVTGAVLGSDQIVLGTARLGAPITATTVAAHWEGTANIHPGDRVQVR